MGIAPCSGCIEASLRHINATLEDMVTQRTRERVEVGSKYRQLVENIHEIFLMGKVEADFMQGAITFISPQVESILSINPMSSQEFRYVV